ncbi:hypothetical protein OOK31_15565 [Streptomyces sp. NBC_00249]|uniref:hypothetical protein n=1 Tax=Streptomyces sp. NBC_00249 TaxID=2975690 RepID=UPI00224CD0F6|nr:hypothetical protein [Streptomyces sp. NBC_00249]MCX5195305.1 hypothetical protein [Streptomyces sp. NBC_00249]
MSRRPRSRPARPGRPRAGALFVGILSALLLAVLHCPSYLPGDAHHGHGPGQGHALALGSSGSSAAGVAPQHGPTEPDRPALPHQGHGPDCAASAPATPAQPESPSPAGTAALPRADAVRPPPARAAPPGADGPLTDRSGRTTLTSVCRWRV